MTSKTFVDYVTPIDAAWLNDVDESTYVTVPANTVAASTAQTTADNHIADTTDAHAASAITNTPAGSIAATTVQTALNELDTEKLSTTTAASTYAILAGSASQAFAVAAPTTATQAVPLSMVGLMPTVASHATTMDIFGAAGATVSVSGTVTVTAIPNCTSAQVGSAKTIIPSDAAGFSITASASLVVDGATSGTYLMPQNANIQIIATSINTFKITTISMEGYSGDIVSSTITAASVSMVNGNWLTVGSISVPAGTWDISGLVGLTTTATTSITGLGYGISATTNYPGNYGDYCSQTRSAHVNGAGETEIDLTPIVRVTLTATTTYYLTCYTAFTVSTLTAGGKITARRVI